MYGFQGKWLTQAWANPTSGQACRMLTMIDRLVWLWPGSQKNSCGVEGFMSLCTVFVLRGDGNTYWCPNGSNCIADVEIRLVE